jgi:hypothetical protein
LLERFYVTSGGGFESSRGSIHTSSDGCADADLFQETGKQQMMMMLLMRVLLMMM